MPVYAHSHAYIKRGILKRVIDLRFFFTLAWLANSSIPNVLYQTLLTLNIIDFVGKH